jgi:esterase/lipase superfamily enzyme
MNSRPQLKSIGPRVAFLLAAICFASWGGCGGENGEMSERVEEPGVTGQAAEHTAPAEAQVAADSDAATARMPRRMATVPGDDSNLEMMAAPSAPVTGSSGTAAGDTGPFESLPAGAEHHEELGYATVQVFYATDRQADSVPLSDLSVTGNRDALVLLSVFAIGFVGLTGVSLARRRWQSSIAFGGLAGLATVGAAGVLVSGAAQIEKHGVTYRGTRGSLVRGVCEVTVPDVHDRGQVERPSLLRFEIREDQRKHVVLTSATELDADVFHQQLSNVIAKSPDRDLLVFIHGYNVDFQSAVRRTAQISVDLPFAGVPVCYSWPSRGSVFQYTVDETNAAWTTPHLKQFLLELAESSGAESINVVAHSMGNRPTTQALVEIGWQREMEAKSDELPVFDRVVLAAPDVDADRFRRDLAPELVEVAEQVTLYASSDDQALIASQKVHGYPRAGESGENMVVVPGIETVDVSGIDLSLLGHSYYGDNQSMLHELYELVRARLPAPRRQLLVARRRGEQIYWQLIKKPTPRISAESKSVRESL